MRHIDRLCGALIVAAALTPTLSSAAVDPREGEALYVGTTPLKNGGAPCLACHGLAGHGLAFSASFGPDLSAAGETYDAETLATALEDVPFPSMEPIYRGHALTQGERADLAAFLLEARAAPPPAGGALGRLLLEAGLVAAAILALLAVLFRRRMPPVTAALAAARRAEGGSR
ncbi:c-type cytochrome [Anaeromyxobacter terrae]|uniref:c-type cytochrome n=1 Tax=Anaeromyxobacter terrae TaxID=2925406 RepID=UPI001F59AF3C|nr:cytochrome c [Anaeromyxobacter sp. SG22]